MKLKNWLSKWLETCVKNVNKEHTYVIYYDIVSKHIVPHLGDMELEELRVDILQDFVAYMSKNGNIRTGGKLAPNTVRGVVSVLKQSLDYAQNLNYIKHNNMHFVRCPSMEEKRVNAFDVVEQQKIERFIASSKKQNYIGVIVCLYTGIRLGELLSLKWEDIDFERGMMHITKTTCVLKRGDKYVQIVDKPKSKAGERDIPLSKNLIEMLQSHQLQSKGEWVLSNCRGNMVSPSAYQKTFANILKKCGISKKGFHSLRHTFATRAIEFGMDVKTLSEILGHTSPNITLSRYAHSMLSYKIEMMNKIGMMQIK